MFVFIKPRNVNFKVNSEALINFICEKGLPHKKASYKRDGYWFKATMVACNKVKPSTKITKAVSNHWYKNFSNFRANVIDLVTQKVCMILLFAIHGHRRMLWTKQLVLLSVLNLSYSNVFCTYKCN